MPPLKKIFLVGNHFSDSKMKTIPGLGIREITTNKNSEIYV